MKKYTTLLFCLLTAVVFAQTLNLPVRSKKAMNGKQFEATISSATLSLTDREDSIYKQIVEGNVPNFYRNFDSVISTGTTNGVKHKVKYYVAPDYVPIGIDSDYYLCPMSPMLATMIGNLTGTTLCTCKMVGDVWSAAQVKLEPQTIPPSSQMSTVPVMMHHDSLVDSLRDTYFPAHPLGQLVSGDQKDVVISNLIYNTANRVVIFGWYYPTGGYIQPMTNVHADTYMDYSHGIRLVQNDCVLDDSIPTTIQSVLESSKEDSTLSDEGVIAEPYYPYYITLNQPTSFAVLQNTPTSLKVVVKNDPSATHYNIYTSTDGVNYYEHVNMPKSNLVVSGLTTNRLYYVKIMAYDSLTGNTSPMSEVLAAVPSSRNDSILLVSGFERNIAGNTYNFTIQHGSAFHANNKYVVSCTHKAITDNLVALSNYRAIDWIAGEESTTDTSITPHEQTYLTSYLQQGGYLFVSGSELGYNLYGGGNAANQAFYTNYLKARYISDAPENTASKYYASVVGSISGSIYDAGDSVNFDNGTHGTYDVNYPDAIAPIGGAQADMHYTTLDTEYACIHYKGVFNGGSKTGKLVYMAYPFETIYPAAAEDTVMKDIIIFFLGQNTLYTSVDNMDEVNRFVLYPNPNNGEFTIRASGTINKPLQYKIYDISGRRISEGTIQDEETHITCNGLNTGTYLVSVYDGDVLKSTTRLVIVR